MRKMVTYERHKNDEAVIRRRVGQMVRQRRESLGLYQSQLAEKWGVSRAAICHLEAGRTLSVARIRRIAKFLGVTADELLEEPEHAVS